MPILTPLTGADESIFLAIAAAKRGKRSTRLRRVWPKIKERYDDYERCSSTLETLVAASFSAVRAGDCKHCYDSPTRPLCNLIGQILRIVPSNGSTLCQYCLIGEIDSVDHYAPKDLFPEFSVLPRNLIASCGLCNRLKSSRWLNAGMREIFSLYFEDLPEQQFLFGTIDFPSGDRARVKFELRRTKGITMKLFARIKRQFEILNLIERYNRAGAEFVTEMLLSTKALPSKSRSDATDHMNRVALGFERQFGKNHIKRVVCLNLASSTTYMRLAGMS